MSSFISLISLGFLWQICPFKMSQRKINTQELDHGNRYGYVVGSSLTTLFSGKVLFKHGLMFPGKSGDTPS
jgi:hypothetical protein